MGSYSGIVVLGFGSFVSWLITLEGYIAEFLKYVKVPFDETAENFASLAIKSPRNRNNT